MPNFLSYCVFVRAPSVNVCVFLVLKSEEFQLFFIESMISGVPTHVWVLGVQGLIVCELIYHARVVLCLRVRNCLVITSADPINS